MECVSVRVSLDVLKYHDQKQIAEERVYLSLQLSGHTTLPKEVTTETQVKNGSRGNKETLLTGLLAKAAQVSFLTHLRATCPGVV